jgi:hypothetical protein
MRRSYWLVLALAGCASAPAPSPPRALNIPLIAPERALLNLGSVRGAQGNEAAMLRDGFALANAVILSECFREEVLKAPMVRTNGRTPAQVHEHLTRGAQTLDVVMFTGNWWQNRVAGTVGYENEGDSTTVHMNRYSVKSPSEAASNLLHEAAHGRGYRHKNARDSNSVPYTMNDVYEACEARVVGG